MKHIDDLLIRPWQAERGYFRKIICPYASSPDHTTQVQLTEIRPGDRVSTHYHKKQTEYIYFLDGECEMTVEQGAVHVQAGDLLVIETLERHSAENSSSASVRFLTVKVNGSDDDTIWEEEDIAQTS